MAVASAVDFVLGDCASQVSKLQSAPAADATNQTGMKLTLAMTYMFVGWAVVFTHDISDPVGLSFCLFFGAALQAMAVMSLCLKVKATKSVAGISSQSFTLFALSLTCRLACTMIYDGYLSADNSGDVMYQCADMVTLFGVVYLLYAMHKTLKHTYEEERDTFPLLNLLAPCFVLACFVHGDLNRFKLFDILWAFSLNVEVVQMLPQVYMLAKSGGVVDKTTAHFVANMFLSCIFRFMFWVWAIPGCDDLSSDHGWAWDMHMAGYYIVIAHILETIVLLDFMYYYVKAMRAGKDVYLPKLETSTFEI